MTVVVANGLVIRMARERNVLRVRLVFDWPFERINSFSARIPPSNGFDMDTENWVGKVPSGFNAKNIETEIVLRSFSSKTKLQSENESKQPGIEEPSVDRFDGTLAVSGECGISSM